MIRDEMTIVFQGDSITDCGRDKQQEQPNLSLGAGYAMLTAASLLASHPEKNLRLFNRGISGHRIVDLYARWKIDALNLRPDLLSILVGINDTWHHFNRNNGVEVPRYRRIYHDLLTWTREALPDVTLVLCEPFFTRCGAVTDAWIPDVEARQVVVRELAEEFDAIHVPFQSMFDQACQSAPPEYWASDGVHPTYAGHHLMSQLWLEKVTQSK